MGDNEKSHATRLWVQTPLIYSAQISARLGCDVYLKLETLQPSQSFKYRGISLYVQRSIAAHGPGVHLIAASSGNAGLAVACAAKNAGVRCTVYIPDAAASVRPVLEREKAEVVVGGKQYIDARRAADAVVEREENAVLVPSYDDPILWEGHSSMIHEIQSQLPAGTRPSALLCSVGGGGLLGGVLKGCQDLGWKDVQVVAMETLGSNCFHRTMLCNLSFAETLPSPPPPLPEGVTASSEGNPEGVVLASLSTLTSRAASLGATSPSAGVVKMALDKGKVRCVSVEDEMSMAACLFFAEEHKIMTELACSTTLVPAYSPALFQRILPPPEPHNAEPRVVVFIVCGGVKISLKEMVEYQEIVTNHGKKGTALVDSEMWGED